MTKDSINDLSNLIFFTEKGYEIPTYKTYTVEWEIIPHVQVSDNFISNPKGHFMFNVQDDEIEVSIIIDEYGKIDVKDTNIYFKDNSTTNISTFKDILYLYKENRYSRPRTPNEANTEETLEQIYNTVKITFNTLTVSETKELPIFTVFNNNDIEETEPRITYEYNETSENNTEVLYTYYGLKNITLQDLSEDTEYKNIIEAILKTNFGDNTEVYESFIPGVRYSGIIHQDKVSEDFVASSTFIMLEENKDENNNISYKRPIFTNESLYKFQFRFQDNSEMKFISTDSVSSIIWNDSYTAENTINKDNIYLFNTDDIEQFENTPIYFTVGFTAELEGCYQNVMAIYIIIEEHEKDDKLIPEKRYLLGLFTFFTEVIGEDERYRALLGNLGIPDPINYPNIFKSQDPDEQGIDWKLINMKSKELMINYDNIFPYAGTYKALAGAVKFLGYYDIIFKEWYKIKNQNGRDKFVALQTYDIQKEETLESKLKRINVEYGEFERYKKLNRLCMIYHINDIDDISGEYMDVYSQDKNDINLDTSLYNKFIPSDENKISEYKQLPKTFRIYEYRTDEILSKLYSVKAWLEQHILGVNCYISDICGEGIIIERLKSPAYVTEHHIQDYTIEGKFTPKIESFTEFKDSSAIITCTLSEFNDVSTGIYNLSFEDYEYTTIETFIHDTINVNDKIIYISSPLQTLVPAVEYEFVLDTNKKTGTLAEFTDKKYIQNPITIDNNRLTLFNDYKQTSKIDHSELPIIEIVRANIRYCQGNWNNNIRYAINIVDDPYTGKQMYSFTDLSDNSTQNSFQKILLYPYDDNKTFPEEEHDIYGLNYIYNAPTFNPGEEPQDQLKNNAEFQYTNNTKWNIPMIIIKNYYCKNNKVKLDGYYILEILNGRLLFRNKSTDYTDGKCYGAEVTFNHEYLFDEITEELSVNYTYISDRKRIYEFNKNNITIDQDITDIDFYHYLDNHIQINDKINLKVNRSGEYNIQVNAYDQYNHIFNKQSNNYTNIPIGHIALDTIINTEYISNNSQFFTKNMYGTKIDTEEILTDISINSSIPIAPYTYKLYDIDIDRQTPNIITYDMLLYSQSIPMIGDFILFNNFTEKVTNLTYKNGSYNLKLLDENPNPDSIRYASHAGIVVYDNVRKEIIYDSSALEVTDISIYDKVKKSNTIINSNKSYINLKSNTEDIELKNILENSSIATNNISVYVYNMSEQVIKDKNDISVDYDNKLSYITLDKPYYLKEQNIKICYASEQEIHNKYTNNVIDNETTYQLLDVSLNSDNRYTYTVNGIIDLYKLNNKFYHNKAEHISKAAKISLLDTSNPYYIKICPAHLKAVQYISRVENVETNDILAYNLQAKVKNTVTFSDKQLFLNNYIDTVYSGTIYNYDPLLLQNIFVNPNDVFDISTNLYLYRDFPVTVNKGRVIILKPQKDQTILTNKFNEYETPYKIKWSWKSYLIDDVKNTNLQLNLEQKQTIFESINPILIIKPELIGPQSPEFICMDIYGNTVTNYSDGFIYVDTDKTNNKISYDMSNRDIYYNDVYLVGFTYSLMNDYIMSADGETTTFAYIDNNILSTGANTKSNIQPLRINYKLYYNNGVIEENEGAEIFLLNKGKKAKSNKVKISLKESEYPHKHINANIQAKLNILKTHKRDLVKPDQLITFDIQQYGYSKTIRIYDLNYSIKPLPKGGITLTKEILYNYITNISYTIERSEGEIETINGKTLQECNLQICNFTYIDKILGKTNIIAENVSENKLIGTLSLNVQFYVNGVTNILSTIGFSNVYQN